MPPLTKSFDVLVQHQLGLVTHAQLLTHGWTQHAIEHAQRTGRLLAVHPGVYRSAGTPLTHRAELLAACLRAGPLAAASHRAAAHLWGLLLDPGPVEITVPYGRHPTLRGVVVHRSRDLHPEHVMRRAKVPVTKPARALLDAGAVVPLDELTKAVDTAVVKGLVTYPAIHAALVGLSRRGRPGVAALRAVLADRPLGDRRPESVLEPVAARLCRRFGIDRVHYQYEIAHDNGVYRVDFGIPHVRVGIEIDGLEVHGAFAQACNDRVRRRRLIALGWELREYTAGELYRRPAAVANEIIAAVARRERLLSALGGDPDALRAG